MQEWEDSCDTVSTEPSGASHLCHARGGSYRSQNSDLACAAEVTVTRNFVDADLGFRCCGVSTR